MADTIVNVAQQLRAQREQSDPVSEGLLQHVIETTKVLEVLERLRTILFDRSPSDRLEGDLEVAHGLLSGLIGDPRATRVIDRLPEMRHCIAMDVEAAFHGDPAADSYGEILAAYPSCQAVSTYRIAHEIYGLGNPIIARIMSEHAHANTGIDIHPGATIGCHFFIDHGTGVVVGETTVIGNRVKLYHGVTLGAFSNRKGRNDRGSKRHPTIEDDVTIYPNATILGGETSIGRGSVIGGNAWLTESVPPFTRVIADPPRLQLSPNGGRAEEAPDWQV